MNAVFHALANEATFTREILGSGLTQIGRANYARKGMYFQAFTSLSTGLERIGKMCLLLDYYIKNEGEFPTSEYNEELKKAIGHDLCKLYERSIAVINDHSFNLRFIKRLDDPIHTEILKILSSFARGDRYSNINFLTKAKRESDPTYEWYMNVDMSLFERRVSERKRKTIRTNAARINMLASSWMLVRHTSESREELNTVESASYQTGVFNAVSKYRQLYTLQIIRYWVELLIRLQNVAMQNYFEKQEIPALSEIFALFLNEDSYFLTRKTFDEN